ncbi:MAG: hypothetical protein JXR31_14860 [Prolixibacteraceae bacterium]|nr:hypothetical protein [Prolixibacteraceae bacterium]MBN2775534.1 hypothetical protein [Prolixibacteraceae bacterium]
MKKVAILIAVFVFPLMAFCQGKKFEYTPKVKNKVEITNLIGEISIRNASGPAIVIESDYDMERPERAEGLKLLGSAEDNTDLGISVTEEDGVVKISGVTRQVQDFDYVISIPAGIAVSLDYSSPFVNGDLDIDSYNGSLEITTLTANVTIKNSTGPFTVNSVSGDVEVVFSKINQDEPTSLASVSGFVDVTIPTGEKANIEISNITGNVYNNLDLQSKAKDKKDDRSFGMNTIKQNGNSSYTLNGGGQKLLLNSVSGNIYIRKK